MLWNELPNWGAVEATNIYYQIHINKFPAFSVLVKADKSQLKISSKEKIQSERGRKTVFVIYVENVSQ